MKLMWNQHGKQLNNSVDKKEKVPTKQFLGYCKVVSLLAAKDVGS